MSDLRVARATGEDALLHRRAEQFAAAASDTSLIPLEPSLPDGYVPWWRPAVVSPQRRGDPSRDVDLDGLLIGALRYSPNVQAIRHMELARRSAIVEADAEFDAKAFMESKLVRTSEPVGDLLTTGGPPRYRDSTWRHNAGLRRKTRWGGTLEASQQYGYQDNNSLFLDPKQQGTARLVLGFTQPLLNGAGRAYNVSPVVLAELDSRIAHDEAVRQIEQHLLEVTRAYWDLYLRRTASQQRRRHYERAQAILAQLESRREVDSVQSQVLKARAAVAARQAELNRAETATRNAEARIRALVNSPDLFCGVRQEFIPRTVPSNQYVPVSLQAALIAALKHRSEIDLALQEVKMASTRLQVSTKELLPVLNLVLETYVAGLEGNSDIGSAWTQQFTEGEPGYTAGLVFEAPLGNRAAQARRDRRRHELIQMNNRFRSTVDMLMVEVEIAVREVCAAHRDIHSKYAAMLAVAAEVDYVQDRWSLLAGDDRAASLMLDDLLSAQDRLAAAEFAFAESQRAYMLALVQLKRATGTLLEVEDSHPTEPSSRESAGNEESPEVLPSPDA